MMIWKWSTIRGCLGLVALLVGFLLPAVVQAGQAKYVYDELGRLIRVVNEQGDVAIYNYDSVGNLLSIQRTTSSNLQPVINSITPSLFGRGTQIGVTLTGQFFLSGILTTDNPNITVSNAIVTDDTVSATFATSLTSATGTFNVTLTTSFGSASVPIVVSEPSVAPTNLTALAGNNFVMLDWDDNSSSGLQGYHVYRGTTSGGSYTRLTSALLTTSQFRDETAINGTTYYYVVTATNTGFGESTFSNEVQATPANVTPTNLTALAGNHLVILDWADNTASGLQGYYVYRGTTSGGPYTRLTSALLTASEFRDETVINDTTYYYVVTATHIGFVESDYSNEATATPQGGPTTVCGTIMASTTWRLTGSPFQVTCDVTIRNNAVLTIEPGVEVRFASGTGLIVGVAIAGGAGGLSAVGTTIAPILFTSAQPTPAPGNWKGLDFTSLTIGGSTLLDHVIVEYGGAGTNNANINLNGASFLIQRSTIRNSSGRGIRVQGNASPTINQDTVSQNAGYGLIQEGTAGSVTLTGSSFQNNGSYPVRVRANTVGLLSGNTYAGNNPDAIEVIDPVVSSSQTWQNQGVPLIITSDMTIQGLAVLTINPGVQMRFASGTGLQVGNPLIGGIGSQGALTAVGTSAVPVVFTSAQASPAPGDWKGIDFTTPTIDASTQLDYVIVEYGGSGTNNANVYLNNASFPIQRSTIRNSSGHGIRLQGSISPTINQDTVSQNAGYGLIQEGTAGSVTLTGSSFQNNGSYPVRVRANTVGLLSGNTYVGNNPDAIEVIDPVVVSSQTWQNQGVPLIITVDMTIQGLAVLTLNPGVQMRFAAGTGLHVGNPLIGGTGSQGALTAVGTSAAPIVFTSAQASPGPGDWKGIDFTTPTIDASTRLDYVIVEFGGAGTNNSNIRIDGANFPVQHSTIRNSSGYGIRLTSSNPTVNFNSITGNPLYGLFNATSTITVNAESNWWGNSSGPTHASNPGGSGDAVSDFVDFTPWLISPP